MTETLKQPSPQKDVPSIATNGSAVPEFLENKMELREKLKSLLIEDKLADYVLALVKQDKHFMEAWAREAGWLSPKERKGYVRLAEDQSLPEIPFKGHEYIIAAGTQVAMQGYGWKKVEDAT